jgi:ACT domain-containing protein
MSDEPEPIRFTFNVVKIQTMVDGGIRMTLDLLPPTTNQTIMDLMDCRKPGIILECAALAIDIEKIEQNKESKQEYGL